MVATCIMRNLLLLYTKERCKSIDNVCSKIELLLTLPNKLHVYKCIAMLSQPSP